MSGRIRSIKPELLDDAVTANLSDKAFRLFIAAIVLADDYGRLRAEPGWLMGQIFWARAVPSKELVAALEELSPLLRFYEVNGQRYAEIRNWNKHQKVDRPGKPRIPAPLETSSEILATPSRESRDTLATDLRSPTTDQGPPTNDHVPHAAEAPVAPRAADEVHAHYVETLKAIRPRRRPGKLRPQDRKKIQEHLRNGLSIDDLKRAVDGLMLSSHHLGENDRHTEYLDLEYALRRPAQMAALVPDAPLPPPPRQEPEGPGVPAPPEALRAFEQFVASQRPLDEVGT